MQKKSIVSASSVNVSYVIHRPAEGAPILSNAPGKLNVSKTSNASKTLMPKAASASKAANESKTFIVLIHGWLSSSLYFRKYFALFKKKRIPFIAIDLRGHGSSDSPNDKDQYEIYLLAKDIRQIMEEEGIDKVVLLGHSLGGMVALEFYDMWPDKVKSLVLCNTSYRGPRKSEVKWNLLGHTVKRIFREAYKKENISKKESILESFRREFGFEEPPNKDMRIFFPALKVFEFDAHNYLANISVPVLIIASRNDEYFGEEIANEMHKKISNSKLLFLDASHDAPRKKFREVSKEILRFLEKIRT